MKPQRLSVHGPAMHRRMTPLPMIPAAAVALLLLTACGDKPPIVSADTSCERFAHISATAAQIEVFKNNWDTMEAYADQVVQHNIEYDKSCLGPVKP